MGDGHALTRKRQIEKFKIAVFLPQAVGATKQTFMAFKPDVPVQFVTRNQLHLDFGQYTKAAQRDPRTFQHIVILPVADFQKFATARDHAQASDFRRQGGQGRPVPWVAVLTAPASVCTSISPRSERPTLVPPAMVTIRAVAFLHQAKRGFVLVNLAKAGKAVGPNNAGVIGTKSVQL